MKPLNEITQLESNTEYVAAGDLSITLSQTTRLTDPVYRAIYPSEKRYLDTAFYLKELQNVTLDFGGATLLLRDETIQPFVIDGCENITVKNLTVEYERGWLNEIDVIEADTEKIVLRQTEMQKKKFPVKVENGELIPVSGKREYRGSLTEPHFLNLYSHESGEVVAMRLVRIGKDLRTLSKEEYPFHYYDLYAEEENGCIVLRGEIPADVKGGYVSVQTHSVRDVSSFFLIRSHGVTLENVRIINGAGMGILGMYTKDIMLKGVKYTQDERSQGMASNAADATHLISCFGRIEIVDCVYEGMKDDAINIHGNYYVVTQVSEGSILAKLPTDTQKDPSVNAYFQAFGAGDTVQIFDGSSMVEKATIVIREVEVVDDFHVRMTIEGDVSEISINDTLENLSTQAEVHIHGCRFGKARTHLRLQTRGKILMEDCDCSLRVLLPGDKNYWYEGSPVRDLTIRSCRFTGERGQIIVKPDSFEIRAEATYYHQGIKILSNTFETAEALILDRCDDIVFHDNVNTNGLPFIHQIRNCGTVQIDQ